MNKITENSIINPQVPITHFLWLSTFFAHLVLSFPLLTDWLTAKVFKYQTILLISTSADKDFFTLVIKFYAFSPLARLTSLQYQLTLNLYSYIPDYHKNIFCFLQLIYLNQYPNKVHILQLAVMALNLNTFPMVFTCLSNQVIGPVLYSRFG